MTETLKGKKKRTVSRWCEKELRVLQRHYKRGYAACQRLLPGRTYSAVKGKARELGMVPRRQVWTGKQVSRLRALHQRGFTRCQLAEALGLRVDQVSGALRYHRLKRHNGGPTATPSSLLNEIRERAHDRGISLAKLNREVCPGHSRVFTAGTRTRIDPKWLFRAVEYLGGSIEVVWAPAG